MPDRSAVILHIREAFGSNGYPGDPWLVGSRDGCEPEEEAGAFRGRTEWATVESSFLDEHAGALNFFSEAGLRFYLPAYLIADLRDELQYAEPVFTLTHGFTEFSIPLPVGRQTFMRRSGKSVPLNPRRFGAITFDDSARYRLSVFTREEAAAIIEYLEFKRDTDPDGYHNSTISAAIDFFWRERAVSAPTRAEIEQHIADEDAYLEAIQEQQHLS